MNNINWRKLFPHFIAIGIFLIVSVIYCKPALEGKVVNQHDMQGTKGMAQQSVEYREKYGHYPLWTNSMFGGMPAYQIIIEQNQPLSIVYLSKVLNLGLPQPFSFFFTACVCFYILMLVMGVNPWIGIISSLAYAYSTYDPIIIAVGHVTKMQAIGYMPAVIASIILLYRRKYLGGAMMLAVFFGLQMTTNHIQIVYYTLIMALAVSIGYFVKSIRQKRLPGFFIASAIAAVIGVIGLGENAVGTFTSLDYVKYSMRGGASELSNSADRNTTEGGLDKDYAFQWSYGLAETFTLVHPSVYGGGNGGHQFKSSKFADKLTEVGYPEETALQFANGSAYWGPQTLGTSGPVYLGAVICFLFILGLTVVQGWHKWWMIAVSIFAILLAWGKHFESFNYFVFDYLPLYKKFRAPAMSLVIPQFCFPLLGALALQTVLFGQWKEEELIKKLKLAAMITGGVFVALLLFYLSADYTSANDEELKQNFANSFLQQSMASGSAQSPQLQQQADDFGKSFTNLLKEDRQGLFISDFIRNLVLVALALAVVFFFVRQKIKVGFVITALTLLSLFDLLNIDKRYLSDAEFVDPATFDEPFTPSPADVQISADTGYYRVFNQTGNPFMESITSYHHNSIGGYHPAKLILYQDLVEHQLSKGNIQVYSMLNTKYFIVANQQTQQPVAQINPLAFGPAWLVKGIKYVADGKEEMKALDSTNLRDTAVIQQEFKRLIQSAPQPDSSAFIRLVKNLNDEITYQFSANTPQFAVFSEIYYPGGWTASIDGKASEICKVNYALRGLSVPAGDHTIVFKFAPETYKRGNTILLWSTLFVYVLLIGGFIVMGRKYVKQNRVKT